ncbi:hypothetical protein [Synergistes jonesii]|nr:hypothetical protein [Synergistes jonesii]
MLHVDVAIFMQEQHLREQSVDALRAKTRKAIADEGCCYGAFNLHRTSPHAVMEPSVDVEPRTAHSLF